MPSFPWDFIVTGSSMGSSHEHSHSPSGIAEADKCLARSVLDEVSHDPTLEAVTINPEEETISVATIGKADVPQITERIRSTIERVQAHSKNQCKLLVGKDDCHSCVQPLTEKERQRITIHQDAGKTTIARVTC